MINLSLMQALIAAANLDPDESLDKGEQYDLIDVRAEVHVHLHAMGIARGQCYKCGRNVWGVMEGPPLCPYCASKLTRGQS